MKRTRLSRCADLEHIETYWQTVVYWFLSKKNARIWSKLCRQANEVKFNPFEWYIRRHTSAKYHSTTLPISVFITDRDRDSWLDCWTANVILPKLTKRVLKICLRWKWICHVKWNSFQWKWKYQDFSEFYMLTSSLYTCHCRRRLILPTFFVPGFWF